MKVNTNPVTRNSPQGMHTLGNEWHGIGVGGHIALVVIIVAILWFMIAMYLAGRR